MIPETPPYNNYTGDGVTTQFDFDFYIESASQLVVSHTASDSTITTLVKDTDYSIHEIGNENGSYITFPLAGSTYSVLSSSEVITLQLSLPISQQSEYGTSSELDLESLEYSFDYLTRIAQIQNRQLQRSIKVAEGSDIETDELSRDLIIVADNINQVNTVSTNINNVNTTATNISSVNTVSGSIANVNTTGSNISKVNTVGTDLALGNNSLIKKVNDNKTNIDAVAGNATNINAVNANKTNINAVAGNATNINAVNANKTNINAVAGNATNINAVNANKTNINTVAVSIANVNTTAGSISNVNTVAGSINKVNAVGTDIANVNTCADNITAITDAPSYAATCQQIKEDISAFDFIDGGYSYTNPVNIYDGGNASNGVLDIIQGSDAHGLCRITFDDIANINQLNKTNLIVKELSEQVAILTNILNSLTSNIDGGNAVA